MPESRTRKSADEKKVRKQRADAETKKTVEAPTSRRWVPPTFITVGLLGVAWLIVYYVAGQDVPLMSDLGNWNILIGMGGMAAAFGLAALLRDQPPAATFRLIASPLVTWIWLGAIVVFLGGLLALWPAPDAARRKSTARAAARVAQDLGRA